MAFTIPLKMSTYLAEEIGLHLGDGSMNYYKGKGFYQLRGHICDDKEHYLDKVKFLYKYLFNLDINLRNMPSTRVFGFQVWLNELVDFKTNVLKLPLGPKLNIFIPDEIMDNLEFSKAFLRGYFDTDGCLYLEKKRGRLYPRVEMATISKNFVNQLKIMLTKLEFRFCFYTEKREEKGWHDLYRIIIRGDIMVNKWFKEINPSNPKHKKKWASGDLNSGPHDF